MSETPKIKLHGGTADGYVLPVSRLVQGVVVNGTLYQPPAEPAPYYPDWFAVAEGETQ